MSTKQMRWWLMFLVGLAGMNALVFGQPGQSEFVPVNRAAGGGAVAGGAASDCGLCVRLGRHAGVRLVDVAPARQGGAGHQRALAAGGQEAPMNFANMTSAHFIFIPTVLFVGSASAGCSARARRRMRTRWRCEKESQKETRSERSAGAWEHRITVLHSHALALPHSYAPSLHLPIPSRYASIGGKSGLQDLLLRRLDRIRHAIERHQHSCRGPQSRTPRANRRRAADPPSPD